MNDLAIEQASAACDDAFERATRIFVAMGNNRDPEKFATLLGMHKQALADHAKASAEFKAALAAAAIVMRSPGRPA